MNRSPEAKARLAAGDAAGLSRDPTKFFSLRCKRLSPRDCSSRPLDPALPGRGYSVIATSKTNHKGDSLLKVASVQL